MIKEMHEITLISQTVLRLFELGEENTVATKMDVLLPQLGITNVIKDEIADVS